MQQTLNISKVSVIIPLYNNWNLTKKCLKSLDESQITSRAAKLTPEFNLELVLVDNGSYDNTLNEINQFKQTLPFIGNKINYHRMENNLGFAKGCNFGVQHATGELLLFLNNDTEIFPGAIESMIETHQTSPSVGIVGGRLLFPNLTIQHAGVVFDPQLHPIHVFRKLPAEHPLVLEKRTLAAVTGALMMLSKKDFEQVGGFDEGYRNSFEDIDLCLKIRELGKEIIYDPDAVIIHYESLSENRTASDEENFKLFFSKWKEKLKFDEHQKTYQFADTLSYKTQFELDEIRNAHNLYKQIPSTQWSSNDLTTKYRLLAFKQMLFHAQVENSNLKLQFENNRILFKFLLRNFFKKFFS